MIEGPLAVAHSALALSMLVLAGLHVGGGA